MEGPGAYDLLEIPDLISPDPARLSQRGEGGELHRAGGQYPRALPDVQVGHVLRELMLTPGTLVRRPYVPSDKSFVRVFLCANHAILLAFHTG